MRIRNAITSAIALAALCTLLSFSIPRDESCLKTGKGPFNLKIDIPEAAGKKVRLDIVSDLSLMSECRDTVLTVIKSCKESPQMEFCLGDLAPGFYQVCVRAGDDSVSTFNMGVNPEQIVSEQDKQPDFDEFWTGTLEELSKVRMRPRFKMLKEHSSAARSVYEVSFQSLGGERVGGILAMPVAPGKYPVIIEYMGYNSDPYYYNPDDNPGTIQFLFTSRGQGIFKDTTGKWFDRGLQSKDDYYYRGAYCDIVRSLDFICSLDKADTSRIVATGESQGGAFSWISASLDHRVKAIAVGVPFMSDFPDYSRIVWWPMWEEFQEADSQGIDREQLMSMMTYFDVKNFTDRIRCPVLMAFGLQDSTCPPHTNFAGYNFVRSEKSYFCVRDCAHAMWLEKEWQVKRRDFLDKYLK